MCENGLTRLRFLKLRYLSVFLLGSSAAAPGLMVVRKDAKSATSLLTQSVSEDAL